MPPDPQPLDQRNPGAHLDRRLRWAGELFPVAYGCTDLALMQRVNAALIASLADPDAARFGATIPTDSTQE